MVYEENLIGLVSEVVVLFALTLGRISRLESQTNTAAAQCVERDLKSVGGEVALPGARVSDLADASQAALVDYETLRKNWPCPPRAAWGPSRRPSRRTWRGEPSTGGSGGRCLRARPAEGWVLDFGRAPGLTLEDDGTPIGSPSDPCPARHRSAERLRRNRLQRPGAETPSLVSQPRVHSPGDRSKVPYAVLTLRALRDQSLGQGFLLYPQCWLVEESPSRNRASMGSPRWKPDRSPAS